MAAPVYSTLFVARFIGSSAQATAAAYVVPAGKVAVVRSISFVSDSDGVVLVGRLDGATSTYLAGTLGMAVNEARQVELRQVFPAGHTIKALWVSGGFYVNVSGYLLSAA